MKKIFQGKYMQKILSTMRAACDKYNLIEENDRIAVGVSGGKDSLVLIKALKMYQRFSKIKFDIVAITIDMFNNGEFDEIKAFLKDLDIEYHIIPSNIYEIVFVERKEKSPCSLCSKLRRGMLNTNAIKLNCNKIALGHTADDVIHTFMLSMFFEGRLSSFHPKSYMSRTGITVIRPLILTDEKEIIKQAKNLPVLTSKCPANKHTKREEMKDILNIIQDKIPIAKDRLFRAITSPASYNLFDKDETNLEESKDS